MKRTLKIDNLREGRAALYAKYDSRCDLQPAYVEMDESGSITADYSWDARWGNAVDFLCPARAADSPRVR